MMIFDDYLLGRDRFPVDLTPKPAIDIFLSGFVSELEVLYRGEQVVIKKLEKPVFRYHSETNFGPYVYEWYSGRLSRVGKIFPRARPKRKDEPLSADEQRALEKALRESKNGAEALFARANEDDYSLLVELGRRLGVPVKEREGEHSALQDR
jgi:hypothetical protein